MKRRALTLLLLASACDCGDRLVSTRCSSERECPPGASCEDGVCVPVQVVAPKPRDSGVEPATCACGRGEVCRAGSCISGCAALSCDAGTTCSEDFVACVAPIVPRACEDRPGPGGWDVYDRWRTDAGDMHRHVLGPPVVADVDDDGFADVLALFFPDFGYVLPAKLRALSGRDGHVLWETADVFSATSGIAVGRRAGVLTAFVLEHEGSVAMVNASTGQSLGRHPSGCGAFPPQPLAPPTTLLAVVDEGHDGGVAPFCRGGASPSVFELDGEWYGNSEFAGVGGFSAVADLFDAARRPGLDHSPELVVVGGGAVTVVQPAPSVWSPAEDRVLGRTRLPRWNADAGRCELSTAPANDSGGAPAIADFDGDGAPEVAVAGHRCLSMLDPAADAGFTLKWLRQIADLTSGWNGVSAFDFDADGKAELLQMDEHAFRIVDGATGDLRLELSHCSATAYEQPVIADLDGDGHAEIVLAVNTFSEAIEGCDGSVTPGIRVIAERNGRWANARPIWNQHSYHVTNVCDGEDLVCGGPLDPANLVGAIPVREPRSWSWYADPRDAAPYNGYRLAVGSRWDAPELALGGVVADVRQCPSRLSLQARVENRAMRSAPAGALVQFFAGGVEIGRTQTARKLRPGAFEIVNVTWEPPAGVVWPVAFEARVNADGRVRECSAADDQIGPVEARCD